MVLFLVRRSRNLSISLFSCVCLFRPCMQAQLLHICTCLLSAQTPGFQVASTLFKQGFASLFGLPCELHANMWPHALCTTYSDTPQLPIVCHGVHEGGEEETYRFLPANNMYALNMTELHCQPTVARPSHLTANVDNTPLKCLMKDHCAVTFRCVSHYLAKACLICIFLLSHLHGELIIVLEVVPVTQSSWHSPVQEVVQLIVVILHQDTA